MILVAINRTGAPLDAAIQITDDQRYTAAEVFQLTENGAAPAAAGSFSVDLVNAFLYEMPAFSVSTIRLIADLPGDFDGDGNVDAADLAQWQNEYGSVLSGSDFLLWQQQNAAALAASAVPEPSSWWFIALAATGLGVSRCVGSSRQTAPSRRLPEN